MINRLLFADEPAYSNGEIGTITASLVQPVMEQPLQIEPLNIPPRIVKGVSTGQIAADILPSPPQLADEPTPIIKGGFMPPIEFVTPPILQDTFYYIKEPTAPAAAPAKKVVATDYKKWFKWALILIIIIVLIRVFK